MQPHFTAPRLIFSTHILQIQWNIKRENATTKTSLKTAYNNKCLLAGVDDTDGLVLAGGADKATVAVPAHVVNDIRVHVLQGDHGLSCAHVPDDDLVITT